jgi:type I restriction enzyme M protein
MLDFLHVFIYSVRNMRRRLGWLSQRREMSPRSSSDLVRSTVASHPSAVFSAADLVSQLPDVSRELVDQVLARMVAAGQIERLARGLYQRSDAPIGDGELPSLSGGGPEAPRGTTNLANLIWSTADEVLRGEYKPHQYGSVILPFTVMRRLDCVLARTKPAVLKAFETHRRRGIDLDYFLEKAAGGLKFWNTSKFDFDVLIQDSAGIRRNLIDYVNGFSSTVRDIFEYYKTIDLINDLDRYKLLFLLVQKFASVNLHPDVILNQDMGQAFEELVRRFSESSNETPGEHYTPRDAIRLMVDLLFSTDEDPTLTKEARIVTLYDPTAGTGGMLSVSEVQLNQMNATILVRPFGQELNEQTYAICKADMLIKGQDVSKIALGNTLSNDAFPNERFDYMLSNPPYGVDWKKVRDAVEAEHRKLGPRGRFGPGLPRISDGQMLFLLHLVSKMHPKGAETSRIAIVMNGSPLFSGGAGSGESEIRKYVIEHDLLEAIVGLPNDMFYNTGIATYVWILSNNKEERRKGKVQLIDATDAFEKMRRSLGNKRRRFNREHVASIVNAYGDFKQSVISKIVLNEELGYRTIVVERPLRLNFQVSPERLERLSADTSLAKSSEDLNNLKTALREISAARVFMNRQEFLKSLDAALKKAQISLTAPQYKSLWQALSERDLSADVVMAKKGQPEPDAELRDTENVPLGESLEAFFDREVKPYVPDAWIDPDKTRVGYEIPFTRYFYKYEPPRRLEAIDADLKSLTGEIIGMLDEVAS